MLRNKIFFIFLILTTSSLAKAEVKVGVILPLSGGAAEYGVACKNGIEMGLEEFKDKIAGKFSIVYEDDQNAPAQTVTSLRKLRSANNSEFILTFASNTSNAINSLADKEGFLLFALATDPNVVKNKANVFSYWVTPEEEVKTLLKELARRNINRIAVFTTQHDGTLAIKKTLQTLAPASGVQIIFDEEIAPDEREFRTLLAGCDFKL